MLPRVSVVLVQVPRRILILLKVITLIITVDSAGKIGSSAFCFLPSAQHSTTSHDSCSFAALNRFGRHPAAPFVPSYFFSSARMHRKPRGVLHQTSERSGSAVDESDTQPCTSLGPASSLPPSSSSWLLTLCFPLWLVYISNQWSRFSINSLVDFSPSAQAFSSMNVDIGFDQAQYGLLASIAFTSLFAIASLGAGYASDRLDRKVLTLGSAVVWSVATLGMAQAQSYPNIVAFRVLTGLACAFSTPTAYTLIKERVPETRQALASSLYGTGVALASALTALSILLDNQLGWRNTLTIIGSFGIVATLASATLLPNDEKIPKDELPSNATTTSEKNAALNNDVSLLAQVGDIMSTDRVRWLYLASLLRFGSGLSIGVWSAPFFRLVFPDDQSSFAIIQASISAIGATASGLIGGAAADWLSAQTGGDGVGRRLWVPVVGSLLAAPAWYFAVQQGQPFETAMLWLAVEYFVAECWFGPSISTLQATVRSGTGGTAQGIFTLMGALGNFVPSILGFLYASSSAGDTVVAGAGEDLSQLLASFVCFGYVSSAFCFAMASRSTPPIEKVKR